MAMFADLIAWNYVSAPQKPRWWYVLQNSVFWVMNKSLQMQSSKIWRCENFEWTKIKSQNIYKYIFIIFCIYIFIWNFIFGISFVVSFCEHIKEKKGCSETVKANHLKSVKGRMTPNSWNVYFLRVIYYLLRLLLNL